MVLRLPTGFPNSKHFKFFKQGKKAYKPAWTQTLHKIICIQQKTNVKKASHGEQRTKWYIYTWREIEKVMRWLPRKGRGTEIEKEGEGEGEGEVEGEGEGEGRSRWLTSTTFSFSLLLFSLFFLLFFYCVWGWMDGGTYVLCLFYSFVWIYIITLTFSNLFH